MSTPRTPKAAPSTGSGGNTEFGRVAERLGIELIPALTPQAQFFDDLGRVERANQTLQDRLIKEMRLIGICGIEATQAFAPRFIAFWNGRFAAPTVKMARPNRRLFDIV